MHFFLHCPLFTNQRCTLLSTVNDIYSSLTNPNDSMFTHILLFGKTSLDISENTLTLNAKINYIISTNKFEESLIQYFVIFCYIFISLTLFCILMSFFEIIHSYSFSSQVCFYLFIKFFFFFLHSLFVYTQVSLEHLRHLVIVIFCSIGLYVRYSYKKNQDGNILWNFLCNIFSILIFNEFYFFA